MYYKYENIKIKKEINNNFVSFFNLLLIWICLISSVIKWIKGNKI